MNISITRDNQNGKQISKSIRRFFTRFHIASALKSANAYKKKGTLAMLELLKKLMFLQNTFSLTVSVLPQAPYIPITSDMM